MTGCGPVVEQCAALGIASSFQQLTGASTAPVLFLLVASPPGAVTPVPSVLDSQ
jgi:hypothetical protein